MLALANAWGWVLEHKQLVGIIIACLVGLLLLWFLFTKGEEYLWSSGVTKTKEAINANVAEIGNITNQIANLELKREGLKEGVNRDMQDLQKEIFGREEIKTEANQALANYHKAVNANSNVDRTAEDLEDVLRRLDR